MSEHEIYSANVPPHCITIHNFGRHVKGLAAVSLEAQKPLLRELAELRETNRHLKEKYEHLRQDYLRTINS